jgi:hypothetical protein
VAVVLGVVLPAGTAAAVTIPAAGNASGVTAERAGNAPGTLAPALGARVGASHPVMILPVGFSHAVSADQGRGEAGPRPGFASGLCVAAEDTGEIVNAAGETYPKVVDPRTGAPPSGLAKVPVSDRVPWGAQERGAFIKSWYDQGYSTPEGGWSQYDIHHIIPREYGGTNEFDNLVPVLRTVHQQEFNPWWLNYGG